MLFENNLQVLGSLIKGKWEFANGNGCLQKSFRLFVPYKGSESMIDILYVECLPVMQLKPIKSKRTARPFFSFTSSKVMMHVPFPHHKANTNVFASCMCMIQAPSLINLCASLS